MRKMGSGKESIGGRGTPVSLWTAFADALTVRQMHEDGKPANKLSFE